MSRRQKPDLQELRAAAYSRWSHSTAEERLHRTLRKLRSLEALLRATHDDPPPLDGLAEVIDEIVDDLEPMIHMPAEFQSWEPADSLKPAEGGE